MPRLIALALAAVVPVLALAACSSSAAPPASHSSSGRASGSASGSAPASSPTASSPAASTGLGRSTDWLQYHGNEARTGNVSGLPPAGHLSVAWSRSLGGTVSGQPLVIGTKVVAATEDDYVYGLSRSTGAVLWKTRVGTPIPVGSQPCGNLNPLGILSTPVYDSQTRLVYVVAQNGRDGHLLAGLTLSGHISVRRAVPSPDGQPYYDQQRGALALTGGRIYVVYGGHYGDCGPYRGTVIGMPASGSGRAVSYLIPTPKQGGIWASGGPVVGPDGTIYVSAGNGAAGATRYDGSDSVTSLTPQLKRTGIFAPADWRTLSEDDLDLGSMSPALLSDGQILQVGKSGVGYLLNAAHLGGVGGQVAQGTVCAAFGGPAVSGTTVYVPCLTGLAAVSTAGKKVAVTWRGPANVWGSPVLGGGAVFVASPDTGVLYELSPATGHVRNQIRVAGQLPHFVSPSLSGGLILVGTLTGVTAINGA